MQDRKLAAIMFTDIVGYTALMGNDEDKAFDMLKRNHGIHENLIDKYNGTLIKEVGDGTLASFPLASDAVRCAIEIQKEVKDQDIPLKIGIHQGEMVMAGADVLGDGVNIASRLQEASKEGCITISGKVYSDIRNKAGIKARYIGEKKLKNVDDPIKVYEVSCEKQKQTLPNNQDFTSEKSRRPYYLAIGIVVIIVLVLIWRILPIQKERTPVAEDYSDIEISIAVKPFDNINKDIDQEAMCDGLTEEIIHHLSIIKDFDKVISRSSSMVFKETDKTIPEIAKQLDVNFILEGSYRQSGDRLRITAQLINADEDRHIWSEIYERPRGDIFDIQSDIAQKVAVELKRILTTEEIKTIAKKPTENIEAYDLYLQGLYYSNKHSEFQKSIEYYENALNKDPVFALAYASIAQSYQFLARYSIISPEEGYPKAKEAVLKALEIDPSLGEAHAALGLIMAIIDWNIQGAEEVLKRAIELSPGSAVVYSSYAQYLRWLGRYDECIFMAKKALELDPLNPMTNMWLANFYTYAGRYEDCIQQAEKIIKLDSTFILINNWLAVNYALMGKNEQAIISADRIVLSQYFEIIHLIISHTGWVYAKSGKINKAEDYLNILFDLSNNQYVDPMNMAIIYSGMEKKEQAFNWITKAVEIHSGQTIYLNGYSDIFFKELSSDPRYNKILEKIGFIEE